MTGVAAAVLAGVVGLVAVLGVQSAANARLSESLKRETDANAELTRSKADVQARYELAVAAVQALHTGVSEDFLLREERFKEHRDRLLKTASEFYGKLGALLGQGTDVASRRALAQAKSELARLTDRSDARRMLVGASRRPGARGARGRAGGRGWDEGRRRPEPDRGRHAAQCDR